MGGLPGYWSEVVRGPTSSDRRLLVRRGPELHYFDPVTRVETLAATLDDPSGSDVFNRVSLFDRNGDGQPELYTTNGNGAAIYSFPGGELLHELTGQPWQFSASRVEPGQFDADPAWELAVPSSQGVVFYDGLTLLPSAPLPAVGITTFTSASDWNDDGVHDLVGMVSDFVGTMYLVDPVGSPAQRSVGGIGYGMAQLATAIDWTGAGSDDIAMLWESRLVVVDPRTAVQLLNVAIESPSSGGGFPRLQSVDYDADGHQDVLWVQQGLLRWLRNPGAIFNLQSAFFDYNVLESRNESLVVTLDNFTDRQRLAVRDAGTLEIEQERDLLTRWNDGATGQFGATSDEEILLLKSDSLVMQSLANGTQRWSRPNSNFRSAEWQLLATPRGECVGAGCQRAAIAENAVNSGSAGSRLLVVDTLSGLTLFEGPYDNCLGCRYRYLVMADMNGDGMAEILSVKSESSPGRDELSVRDGSSFEVLWTVSVTFGFFRGIDVTTSGPTRVGLLRSESEGCLLQLLDPADGSVTASRSLGVEQFGCDLQQLRYVPHDATQGSWLAQEEFEGLVWIDGALDGPVNSNVSRKGDVDVLGESRLVMGGPFELRRISLSFDRVFSDGFEPFDGLGKD